MIGLLRGAVVRARPEQILIDVGGVGYAVRVALSTYYELEARGERAEVELLIHTQVRDDAIELYGFGGEQEKALFEKLISVSGIGPRLALSVLSGMAPPDLVRALAGSDVARLVRIPGVGKKTAERMVLELRDGVQEMASEIEAPREVEVERDVVAALVNLGYRAAEAERALTAVAAESDGSLPFPDLLRASLKRLSRL